MVPKGNNPTSMTVQQWMPVVKYVDMSSDASSTAHLMDPHYCRAVALLSSSLSKRSHHLVPASQNLIIPIYEYYNTECEFCECSFDVIL